MAPYTLQSPLSAGLAAASGVMAGQQAKKDKEAALKRQAMLDAQAQADTQARLGMERSNQEATQQSRKVAQEQGAERLRNEQTRLGIEQDNATRAQATADANAAAKAEKDRRDKLAETFRGKGFTYPKNWDKLSPDAKIAYLEVRRKNAAQNYDETDIKAIDEEMGRVRTQAAAAAKPMTPYEKARLQIEQQNANRPRGGARAVSPFEQKRFDLEQRRFEAEFPGGKKPAARDSTAEARGKDQQDALAALGRVPPSDTTGAKNKIINHFAAKWGLQPDQARALLQ